MGIATGVARAGVVVPLELSGPFVFLQRSAEVVVDADLLVVDEEDFLFFLRSPLPEGGS